MTQRPKDQPAEQLDTRPGKQHQMEQKPQTKAPYHKGSDKLKGKVVVITGGDSGIGRAAAVACAREGADISFCFLEEHKDAEETQKLVEAEGAQCFSLAGDIAEKQFCNQFIDFTIEKLGQIDVLINNAGEQHPQEKLEDISEQQLERTFRSNIFSMFFITQAALPHMKSGGSIINNASVTAYLGNPMLLDYSSTKGAIVGFTRSLSVSLAERGIRVNAVAPGPIWTPLIPSTFPADKVKEFGKDTPLKRPGQPEEVAMAFLFLAAEDSSYISGQTIHVNGGKVLNS